MNIKSIKSLICLVLLSILIVTPSALSKTTDKKFPVPPLGLTFNWEQNNPKSPSWCLNEDDYYERRWSGYFMGTFTVTEDFCNQEEYNGTVWDGGGVGLTFTARVVGRLDEMKLSYPGQDFPFKWPAFTQNAVLVGTKTVGKGANAYIEREYTACAYIGGENKPPMPGMGTWTAILAGDFSNIVSMSLVAQMFPFAGQWHYPVPCPLGQRPPGDGW